MSFRSSEDARLRAIRQLVRETAELPTPEIDWDRVERKLLAQVENASAAPRIVVAPQPNAVADLPSMLRATPARWASSPWPIAFAAAAAGLLVYGMSAAPKTSSLAESRPPQTFSASQPESASGSLRAVGMTSLQTGDLAEASGHPLSYEKPGVVSFTLAPASRARVVAIDSSGDTPGSMTVALDQGSIHADVIPRAHGEAFAVEVGRTRIAVHGTSFTVTREGERVLVDVVHGSVAVGPVGHPGATQGWLLVGPERAAFSLDGATKAEWLDSPAPAELEVVASLSPPVARPTGDSHTTRSKRASTSVGRGTGAPAAAGIKSDDAVASPDSALPEVPVEPPTAVEQERSAVSSILSQLGGCYQQQTTSRDVRFSVESSLKLTILPTGHVHEGFFSPPLSPTLMGCAEKAIASVRFPAGNETRVVEVPVRLSRAPR